MTDVNDARVAQELLFLVLHQLGEPVVIDVNAGREILKGDQMIDINLDEKSGTCTLSVVSIK